MPEITEATPGVFNWIDLMSPDVDASIAFYTEVFGWEAIDQFDEDGENRVYVMFRRDGHDVAGLGGQMDAMQGAPAVWNSYVATDDAAATTEKVEQAGGAVVMPPMQVFDSGVMAIFSGPDGAMISTWQPIEHVGATLVNEHNTWSWSELMTRDVDAAKQFHAAAFGWEYDAVDMGPQGTYWLARADDHQMAGVMQMPPDVPDAAPNHWAVYFTVDDIDEALARVEKAGGAVVMAAQLTPGVGHIAMAHDPQGGSFSLMQPDAGDDG